MWYCPDKYKKDIPNINEELLKLKGDLLDKEVSDVEVHEQVMEIIQTVVENYAGQNLDEVAKSVEDVEISAVDRPEEKILIKDIPFHSIILVPSRIEVTGEMTFPPKIVAQLNSALGL